jgi:hypothetical protein
MKSMSIKEYAITHKLSIYNVVKMTKNGTLKTETKKVDGKDEVFILEKEGSTAKAITSETSKAKIEDYEQAYFKLKIQYDQLKTELEKLQKKTGHMS